jgi:hypothetical protein
MNAANPLGDNDKRRLILEMLMQLKCASCRESYSPQDFVFLGQHKDVWVLGSRCRHCGASGHVLVVLQGATKLESVTDLTTEEMRAADEWSPITTDDVLDVHAIMQEFDGDFEALFAR